MRYNCSMKGPYTVTEEQQLSELNKRIPPIVNVDIVIKRGNSYLVGNHVEASGFFLFPGGRMKYSETPQETALRILKEEVPGVKASIKKLLAVESDQGWDRRSYGVTIYYLLDYISGEAEQTGRLNNIRWIDSEEFRSSDKIYAVDKKLAGEIDFAARTINISTDELLVEVDKDNKEIGTIIKKDAHTDPNRYHRAAHIMIFTSKGDVVLQQRGANVNTSPLKWDMPGGHQVAGESIEQCANLELLEEIGVQTKLTLKRIGLYQSNTQSEYYYLYYGISDGPYGFDKNEVEAVKVYDCEELLKERPSNTLTHVFEYIDELREIWEPLRNIN